MQYVSRQVQKKILNLLSLPKVNLPIKKNGRPKSHVYSILLPGLPLLEPLLLFKAPGLIYCSFVSHSNVCCQYVTFCDHGHFAYCMLLVILLCNTTISYFKNLLLSSSNVCERFLCMITWIILGQSSWLSSFSVVKLF